MSLAESCDVFPICSNCAHPTPDLEAVVPVLENFRNWVKETDEVTDHDLILTAKWAVNAALDITE